MERDQKHSSSAGPAVGKDVPRMSASSARPEAVAREVSALLNSAEGGQLLVEMEAGSPALPAPAANEQCKQLEAMLASTIAPAPPPGRVRVRALGGQGTLVDVAPATEPELHAVRLPDGRFGVYRRVGDRIMALDWTEVRERLQGYESSPEVKKESSIDALLLDWRARHSKNLDAHGGLLLVAQVQPRISSGTDAVSIQEAMTDPARIGIRKSGMHYATRGGEVRRSGTLLSSGSVEEFYRSLEIDLRGTLRFGTRLDLLRGDGVPGCPRSKTIYPLWLLETLASCAALYERVVSPAIAGDVTVALDLVGIDGYSLPPSRYGTYGFLFEQHWTAPHQGPYLSRLLTATRPLAPFRDHPQRLAHSLAFEVWKDFGYGLDQVGPAGERIPYWDSKSDRFEFPE